MLTVYWIHAILLLLFSLSLIYNAWRKYEKKDFKNKK